MRYPALSLSKAETIARRLIEGNDLPNFELVRSWAGRGEDVDLKPIAAVVNDMRLSYEQDRSSGRRGHAEALEGRFAGDVHKAVRDLPVEVLDDPGFWRYLALAEFWWFVAIREAASIERGNVMTYVNGGKECVPFRMFLRAQAIRFEDDYELAAALPRSADFWRSHVLRVSTGTTPALARAFARLQSERAMVSDDLRSFARRLNRLWANVVFQIWSEDDCYELLVQLYDEMFGRAADPSGGPIV